MRIQTLKNVTWGTLILQTLLSIILALGIHGAVLAEDPAPPASTTANTDTFSVGKYLKAPDQGQKYFEGTNKGNPIASFIIQAINFLILSIGSVCFVAIVIGGFTLMTSHGNENQLTKGKDIITYAVIGLVITLTAYYIVAFVQSTFYELPSK